MIFDGDFPDAFDMAFMLGLSEEMAEEEKERRELERREEWDVDEDEDEEYM